MMAATSMTAADAKAHLGKNMHAVRVRVCVRLTINGPATKPRTQ
jgi:hypothetical protein